MATIKRFEDLEIWKIARKLSLEIYEITSKELFGKDYRFRDQIRNAAGSVMDNIAEGFGRGGKHEFINFLSYSKGSTGEVKSQLYRAMDVTYISKVKFDELYIQYDNLGGQIAGFISYLNNALIKGHKFKDRP